MNRFEGADVMSIRMFADSRELRDMDGTNRGRILVAEDNEANRMLALQQLERLGCEGDAVATGAQAVSAVACGNYALVLMDSNMPEMDGLAATTAIRVAERETKRHTIVVAMTASATERDRQACLAAGMDDYLSKPVMMADLESVLARWLPEHTTTVVPRIQVAEVAAAPEPEGPLDHRVLERLRHDLRNDEAFSSLLRVYLVELPRRVDGLVEAAEAGDGQGVRSAAHTMKSTSAMVGATTLSRLSSEVELGAEEPGSVRLERAHEIAREAASVHRRLEEMLAQMDRAVA